MRVAYASELSVKLVDLQPNLIFYAVWVDLFQDQELNNESMRITITIDCNF